MAKKDRPSPILPHVIDKVKRELLGIGGVEPPRAGRFKPGQSGNPTGRPKRKLDPALPGAEALHAATMRLAMTPVVVKANGKSASIPMSAAIVQSQMTTAIKGNPLAQRDALQRIEQAQFWAARIAEKPRALDALSRDHVG